MIHILARPVKSHGPTFDVVERPNDTNKVDLPFLPYPKGGQTALWSQQPDWAYPAAQGEKSRRLAGVHMLA